jgi:hypothetical protein
VEAVDGDKPGSRNSHISYEIINGNYDKKFSIDKDTGNISAEMTGTFCIFTVQEKLRF